MEEIAKRALLLLVSFTVVKVSGCSGINAINNGSNTSGDIAYLNLDLSTGNLMQWTHRDFGLGTDVGSNDSGAGYLWYHSNVGGRKAAGMTATPSAHASPASNSDSVYLWDPSQSWNYAPYEIWLRTSVMFRPQRRSRLRATEVNSPTSPRRGIGTGSSNFTTTTARSRVARKKRPT